MPVFSFVFWLLLVWSAGWLFFPLSRRLFQDLPDAGLAIGRVLFLALWTLSAFWLGHIGIPTHLSAHAWILGVPLALWLFKRQSSEIKADVLARQKAILASEAAFLLVFLVFFLIRGFWSDMAGDNGEKSMDGALIGALIRSQSLPPLNPFSALARMQSYYYFGHLETALITNATFSELRWTYNLMCATIPALCVSSLFSLGAALTGRLKGGLFVTATVLGLGTLQPIYQWLHQDMWSMGRPFHLDFFATSRVIPYTINEYPFFTFQQADLHAHYFDFPFLLATMALAYAIFRGNRGALYLAPVMLGVQILTNTWDFPAGVILVSAAILLSPHIPLKRKTIAFILIPLVSLLVASPYLWQLRTAAASPQLLHQPASPLGEWLLMWGPILTAFLAFLLCTPQKLIRPRVALFILGAIIVDVVLFTAWNSSLPIGWPLLHQLIDWGISSSLVLPLILFFFGLSLFGAWKWRDEKQFLCILSIAGLFALLWAETTWAGFLGDAHHLGFDDYKRQDTVFKFGLQTWLLWGTAASCGAYVTLKKWPLWLQAAFAPTLGIMLITSCVVVLGRTHNFGWTTNPNGTGSISQFDAWDGWKHLEPPEQEAATWLLHNVKPDENMLEAEMKEGGDFSAYARYSSLTGIPTIVGPLSHSFYWAPAPSDDLGPEWKTIFLGKEKKAERLAILGGRQWGRCEQTQSGRPRRFTSNNMARQHAILQHYGVKYVVWGQLENEQYGLDARGFWLKHWPIAAQFGPDGGQRQVFVFAVS